MVGLTRAVVVRFVLLVICAAGWLGPGGRLAMATDVLTWHNGLARRGQNLHETVLTPANVNANSFGRLFTIPVDGKVDAQPLYVAGLTIEGRSRNVIYIATEHDSVYACAAATGAVLWKASMLKAGETPSDPRSCGQVSPEIGITGTPVIDRKAGPHGTIYLVAMSKDEAGHYFQRLHALDLTTGAEEFSGPRDIAASYPGTGDNSVNGNVIFDPKQYKHRPGLVLNKGLLYLSWSSHCDIRPYTGWVMSYNPTTLAQVGVKNVTANGNDGAIWAAGAAPAADPAGNLYFLDSNGTFETTLGPSGFPSKQDYGNCFIKLSTANQTMAVEDYFTMFNTGSESNADQDLGSGGAIVLPDLKDANGAVRHLALGAGKDAHIYVVDREHMGKFVPGSNNNSNVYQDVQGALAGGVFSTPAYYDGRVYFGAVGDKLKAFPITHARLATSAQSFSAEAFGYPGTTPSISANGNTNGIVWAAENANPAVLHAYDANDLSHELYTSNDAANGRDHFGTGNKFIVPTIADGKVFVGTTNGVGVFGLLHAVAKQTSADSEPATDAGD